MRVQLQQCCAFRLGSVDKLDTHLDTKSKQKKRPNLERNLRPGSAWSR